MSDLIATLRYWSKHDATPKRYRDIFRDAANHIEAQAAEIAKLKAEPPQEQTEDCECSTDSCWKDEGKQLVAGVHCRKGESTTGADR